MIKLALFEAQHKSRLAKENAKLNRKDAKNLSANAWCSWYLGDLAVKN